MSHMVTELWCSSDVGASGLVVVQELEVTILWSLFACCRLCVSVLCGAHGNSCWRSPRKVTLTFTPLPCSKARGQMQIKRRRRGDKSFKR